MRDLALNWPLIAAILLTCALVFFALFRALRRRRLRAFLRSANERERIIWALGSDEGALADFYRHERGLAYEFQIGKMLQERGYEVDFHGLRRGRNDGGIDIIATRKIRLNSGEFGTELQLVQCKNYYDTSELDQDVVRKFLGDCYVHLCGKNQLAHPKIRLAHCFYVANPLAPGNNIERYEQHCQQRRGVNLHVQIVPYDEQIARSDEYIALVTKYHYAEKYAAELAAVARFVEGN